MSYLIIAGAAIPLLTLILMLGVLGHDLLTHKAPAKSVRYVYVSPDGRLKVERAVVGKQLEELGWECLGEL